MNEHQMLSHPHMLNEHQTLVFRARTKYIEIHLSLYLEEKCTKTNRDTSHRH